MGEELFADPAERLPVDDLVVADAAIGAAAEVAEEGCSVEVEEGRGSLDATRECLNVRVGEGG